MVRSLLFVAVLCGCGRLGFDPTTSATNPDGGTPVGGRCAIDLDCTSHAACVAQQTCECASGFTSDGGGGCTWSGVVADPELANAPVWTNVGGGTIDGALSLTGMRDPGAARFAGQPLCKLARFTQTVTMPRLAQAGPLVLDLTYRFVNPSGPATRAAVGLGPVWIDDLATHFGWATVRRCLGAGQYAPPASTGIGAPLLLQVSPGSTNTDCAMSNVTLDIDHLDIVPANPGECPDVGLAANGDAEGTDGWTLSMGATSVAAITPGVGTNGSRGVRLYLAQRCDAPAATVPVSIPFDDGLASPAFEIYDRTTAGFSPTIALGNRRLAIAAGTGGGRTTRACVPAPLRGGVFHLTAYLDGGNGTCGDPLGYETILDDVALVDDPRCGTDPTIVDPGFESRLSLVDAFSYAGKGVAQIQTAIVHAGSAALRLDASVTCYGGVWGANVVAPASQPAAGPALTFFYRADPANQTRFLANTTSASFTGTADATWRPGLICLDPALGNRAQRVTFGRSFLGGTCEQAMATETAYLDDLALTTDPSCPP